MEAINPDILSFVGDLGVVGFLVVTLIGGSKGWWIFGWAHRRQLDEMAERVREAQDREVYWRDLAVRSLNISERVIRRDEP